MSDRGSILVVDDEPMIVDLLRTHLTGLGYVVDVALNGGDALMLVELHRPDAVILDLNLPDLSGTEILRRLRAADNSIPVMVLTGDSDEVAGHELLKAGALEYICKPVRLEVLEKAVAMAMSVGRKRPRRGVVLPFEPRRPTERSAPSTHRST